MDRKQRNYDEICSITVLLTTSFSPFQMEMAFCLQTCLWLLLHDFLTQPRHMIYQIKAFCISFSMGYIEVTDYKNNINQIISAVAMGTKNPPAMPVLS